MFRSMRWGFAAAIALVLLGGGRLWAQDDGQDDLDKATQSKITANTLSDLSEVVRLAESAMKKGLSPENAQYAKQLLTSTLLQRGEAITKAIFREGRPDPRWPQFRKLALADLDRVVELDRKQPQAWYFIAQLNILPGGDQDRFRAALDAAVETAGDDAALKAKALLRRAAVQSEPAKKRADLDEAVGLTPQDPAPLRSRGLLLADQGEYEPALADLNKALELAPEHAETLEAQALVLAKLKKYDEAMVSLDKAQQAEPKSVSPKLQKARIYADRENLPAALHELNEAGKLDPANPAVLLLRAGVYQEMGEKEKALADIEQLLEIEPDLVSAIRLRAILLADAGRMDEALASLEKLLESDPKNVLTRLQLAAIHSQKKNFPKALELYSAILADKPDEAAALRSRGDTLLAIGKHTEAVADYEKALELQPKDVTLLNNFAWVLATSPQAEIRDGGRAVKLATEACELSEYKKAYILSTLAAAYAEKGDFEAARKWAQKAVDLDDKEHAEELKKELASYQANQPWRELQTDGQPQPPPPTPEKK